MAGLPVGALAGCSAVQASSTHAPHQHRRPAARCPRSPGRSVRALHFLCTIRCDREDIQVGAGGARGVGRQDATVAARRCSSLPPIYLPTCFLSPSPHLPTRPSPCHSPPVPPPLRSCACWRRSGPRARRSAWWRRPSRQRRCATGRWVGGVGSGGWRACRALGRTACREPWCTSDARPMRLRCAPSILVPPSTHLQFRQPLTPPSPTTPARSGTPSPTLTTPPTRCAACPTAWTAAARSTRCSTTPPRVRACVAGSTAGVRRQPPPTRPPACL